MAETHEFRSAVLSIDSRNLAFVVEAKLEENWEALTVPVYLDEPVLRTLPTLKRISLTVRRLYQSASPLHSLVDGSPVSITFKVGGETFRFSSARVVGWRLRGELGGELIEEVELVCEEENC